MIFVHRQFSCCQRRMSLARGIIPRARCKLLDINLLDNLMVCFEKGMYFLRQAELTIVGRAVSRLESARVMRGLQKGFRCCGEISAGRFAAWCHVRSFLS
jgi:hypothetical protein